MCDPILAPNKNTIASIPFGHFYKKKRYKMTQFFFHFFFLLLYKIYFFFCIIKNTTMNFSRSIYSILLLLVLLMMTVNVSAGSSTDVHTAAPWKQRPRQFRMMLYSRPFKKGTVQNLRTSNGGKVLNTHSHLRHFLINFFFFWKKAHHLAGILHPSVLVHLK